MDDLFAKPDAVLDQAGTLHKVSEFSSMIVDRLAYYDLSSLLEKSGLVCNVLIPGQQWQAGKLRLRLEFVPDESSTEVNDCSAPASPLDEIRRLAGE